MIKILLIVWLIAIVLYATYNFIKKKKPYKQIFVASGFLIAASLILTLITYLF